MPNNIAAAAKWLLMVQIASIEKRGKDSVEDRTLFNIVRRSSVYSGLLGVRRC